MQTTQKDTSTNTFPKQKAEGLNKFQHFPSLQIGVFHYNWLTFFFQPSFLKHYNQPGPKQKLQHFPPPPSLQIGVFHYNWLNTD